MLEDKMKSRKFVGYVPKGEKIKDTFRDAWSSDWKEKSFGMFKTKDEADVSVFGPVVKRTITITWEDKPVKR
jgi:hypothetical protein